jgi:hypothetical protein
MNIVPPGVDVGIGAYGGAGAEAWIAGNGAVKFKADVDDHDVVVVVGVAAITQHLVEVVFIMPIDAGWEIREHGHGFSIVE